MSINLMPWREERRKRLQKDFMTKLGLSALAGVAAVVLLYAIHSAMISGQNKRIGYLDKNIAEAKESIKQINDLEQEKEAMLSRKKVIENLQASRDQLAHVYYELASNAEDGVILNSLEHKNNILEIKGKSVSNSAVSGFVNRIEASNWFDNPEIIIIQNDDFAKSKDVNINDPNIKRYDYDFTIRAAVKNPNAPMEAEDTKKNGKDKNEDAAKKAT